MNNLTELAIPSSQDLPNIVLNEARATLKRFTAPAGETMLAELGIEPSRLKLIKQRSKRTRYRAIINWLTKYQPEPEATRLEKIKGYLETFHHLCDLEEWYNAFKMINIRLNTPTQQLDEQLRTWGYYREQISLYNRLIGHSIPKFDSLFMNALANAHAFLGEDEKAVDYCQKALLVSNDNQDIKMKVHSLLRLGSEYSFLKNHEKAYECFQESLRISRQIQNPQLEGLSLKFIGEYYSSLEKHQNAIECFQQYLQIAQTDNWAQMQALISLGLSYSAIENYDKAIECHQKQLKLAVQSQDHGNIGEALRDIGTLYRKQGDYGKAIQYHQHYLDFARQIEYARGEGTALAVLGMNFYLLKDYNKAIDYSEQSLLILQPIEARQELEIAFMNLGNAYYALEYSELRG